ERDSVSGCTSSSSSPRGTRALRKCSTAREAARCSGCVSGPGLRESSHGGPVMKVLPPRTILVVDDDDDVRSTLARILGAAGYTVVTAESGEEGLQLLASHAVQLAISDQNMPGMSGIDFLKAVRERHPHVLRMML